MKTPALLLALALSFFTILTPQRAQAQEEEQPSVSFSYFFQALEPLGRWVVVDDYGSAWQPYVAIGDPEWRPYTIGHWSYTDAGWTWLSDEEFGWATYHYGRWIKLDTLGWAWVPGYDWAPSWVSWRSSTDNEYMGWAPLPPEADYAQETGFQSWVDDYYEIGPSCYTFVPTRSFCDRDIRTVIVPYSRNPTIIYRSVNITNICYRSTVVNRIYVGGPDLDFCQAHCREPVHRLHIQHDDGSALANFCQDPRRGGHGLFQQQGQNLIISSPVLALQSLNQLVNANSNRRHVDTSHIDRGWNGHKDHDLNDQIRVTMRHDAQRTPVTILPPKTKPIALAPHSHANTTVLKPLSTKPNVIQKPQIMRPQVVTGIPTKPTIPNVGKPVIINEPPKPKFPTTGRPLSNNDLAQQMEQQRRRAELQQQQQQSMEAKKREITDALRRQNGNRPQTPNVESRPPIKPGSTRVPQVFVKPASPVTNTVPTVTKPKPVIQQKPNVVIPQRPQVVIPQKPQPRPQVVIPQKPQSRPPQTFIPKPSTQPAFRQPSTSGKPSTPSTRSSEDDPKKKRR